MTTQPERTATADDDMWAFLYHSEKAKKLAVKRMEQDDKGLDGYDKAVSMIGRALFAKALFEVLEYTPPCRQKSAIWVGDALMTVGFDSLGLMTSVYLFVTEKTGKGDGRLGITEHSPSARMKKFKSVDAAADYLAKKYPETFQKKEPTPDPPQPPEVPFRERYPRTPCR